MIYQKKKESIRSFWAVIGIILALIMCLSINSYAQTTGSSNNTAAQSQVETTAAATAVTEKTTVLQPALTDYKGVVIGMTAEEVRSKLGKKPKIEDKDGFYYIFSDNEEMQIVLDENKKVKVISVIYSGGSSNAPTYEAVFGKDVPLEANPDGRVYKLIRYPQSGFWVAYSSSAGENPTVTVTIQKLWNAQ